MRADGVRALARAMVELQEGLRVADGIGRHGVIDDVAELGVERLLLSDPDLAATIIERELGPLLADPRMGEELVETLQTYFDAGGNRRETARRLHLADRTVAYRLERAEDLLGHGFDGEAGRRLNVALTLRRLAQLRAATPPRLRGSSTTSAVSRDRRAACASLNAELSSASHFAHSRSRSSPTAARAVTSRRPSGSSMDAFGSAWRLSHHAGSGSAQPFMAGITMFGPSTM